MGEKRENGSGRPNAGLSAKRLVAVAVLVGLVAYDVVAFHAAMNALRALWPAHFTLGGIIGLAAAFGFELFFAFVILWGGVLAQAAPTDDETDRANIYILVLMALAAVITELVALPGTIPLGGIPIFFLFLASLMVIYGTAVWLWTPQWILIRRQICFVWVPWLQSSTKELWATSLTCLQWGCEQFMLCAQYWLHVMQSCAEYASQTIQSCLHWAQTTTSTCTSWLPSWLGWLCLAWEVVVGTVCIAWTTIVVVVCVAWFIVTELVCLAWVTLIFVVCLAWMLIATVIFIVVYVVCGLLLIVFICW